jgi:hypothetical protein
MGGGTSSIGKNDLGFMLRDLSSDVGFRISIRYSYFTNIAFFAVVLPPAES